MATPKRSTAAPPLENEEPPPCTPQGSSGQQPAAAGTPSLVYEPIYEACRLAIRAHFIFSHPNDFWTTFVKRNVVQSMLHLTLPEKFHDVQRWGSAIWGMIQKQFHEQKLPERPFKGVGRKHTNKEPFKPDNHRNQYPGFTLRQTGVADQTDKDRFKVLTGIDLQLLSAADIEAGALTAKQKANECTPNAPSASRAQATAKRKLTQCTGLYNFHGQMIANPSCLNDSFSLLLAHQALHPNSRLSSSR